MWHVSHGEKNFGPFTEDKMLALIKAGKLPPTVHVWKEGMADWILLRDSALMKSPAAPALAVAVAPAAPAAPAVAANPFDFSQPAARSSKSAAAINVAVAPQPTAQQLANPYFSDFNGAAPQQPAAAVANPNFRLLRLEGRQLFVVLTTAIAIVATLACAWFTFAQISLLKQIQSGNFRGNLMAQAEASDRQFMIVFLCYLLAMLVAGIALLVWFYRAHVNAQAMSTAKLTDTSGWAVGYFFIPILNLFKPFVGMRDIWRGSFSAPGSYAAPPSTLVTAWWATYVILNFLNRFVVFSFKSQNTSIGELIGLSNIAMIGNILMIVPLGLTIVLVLNITKQQTRKAQKISQGVAQPQQQQAAQPQFQMPQF